MKPKILKITTENATFQIINSLKANREKRNKEGFLVEGVRNINNAIEHGWAIKSFLFSSEKGLSRWAADILRNSVAKTHYDLSLDLLKKLSNKEEESELLAVVEMAKDDLNKIPLTSNFLVVVLDRPTNPGNLGTIIRSCDALGAQGLIITGHAADVYDPAAISASTGSLFYLPIVRISAGRDLALWLEGVRIKHPDLQIIATDEKGDSANYDCDFKKPTVLLVGNETSGLSSSYRDLATKTVKIPIVGSASSLNVAVATSIVLAEASRQKSI